MKSFHQKFQPLFRVASQHPYVTGSVALFGLSLLILRKIHQKFVVYPNANGRYNKDNDFYNQHPRNRKMNADDIQIVTQDKKTLRGWYIKQDKPQYLLIYYHQNAGNIGGRLYYIERLMQNVNTNVLIIAYRGFSQSDGNSPPSEQDIVIDSQAIMKKAIQLAEKQKIPIYVLGRSLGGFSAISTLSNKKFDKAVQGLILQNTFTSIYDVAKGFLPKILFPLMPILWIITAGSYNSISKLTSVNVPMLFIKGCKDQLVPKSLMDQLQQKCSENKKENFSYQVENGSHNDTWYVAGQQYFQTLNEFFGHCSRL